MLLSQSQTFADVSQSGNACSALGIKIKGQRYFVKYASQPAGRETLRRVSQLHAQVQNALIWPLLHLADTDTQTLLIYHWCNGLSLYQAAPARDQHDSRLNLFRRLPLSLRLSFLTQIYLAHLKIAQAGWIMVDFYDGSVLFDAQTQSIHLIDLDEYRPGTFVLEAERLPGSLRFMAPEELNKGSLIDQVTNVFALGACAREFLQPEIQARTLDKQRMALIQQACQPERSRRFQSIAAFVEAWQGVHKA